MSHAVMADRLGPLDNYTLRQYDPGPPEPGQVRIAVKAAGVSFVDVLNATGRFQVKSPVPFIPGSEFACVVESLGAGGAQRGKNRTGHGIAPEADHRSHCVKWTAPEVVTVSLEVHYGTLPVIDQDIAATPHPCCNSG